MDARSEAIGVSLVGLSATVAGAIQMLAWRGSILHESILLKGGLLYAVVGGAALLTLRWEGPGFPIAIVSAVVLGAIGLAGDATFLSGTEGILDGVWTDINDDLRPSSVGGLSWGLAAFGAGLAYALGVLERRHEQWLTSLLVFFASLPLWKALTAQLGVDQPAPPTELSYAILAATITVVLAVPLYRLGKDVKNHVSPVSPSRFAPTTVAIYVLSLQTLALGVFLSARGDPVISIQSAFIGAISLGSMVLIIVLFSTRGFVQRPTP